MVVVPLVPRGPFAFVTPGLHARGACKESVAIDPCKDVVCEGNGTCAVAHGNTAVCLCRPGYQSDGAQCVKGDEVSDSPCDGALAVVMALALSLP